MAWSMKKTSEAFHISRPHGHRVPLVLDSPHSGTEFPGDFGAAVSLERLRQAEDSYVDELFAHGPEAGATLIAARFPRSYVDPNRSLLDIDSALLASPWPGPAQSSRKTELGIGLIWRVLDSGEPIYARKLSVAEGVASAPAVAALARKLGVEMPICEAVTAILAGKIDIDSAIEALLSRPLKTEI